MSSKKPDPVWDRIRKETEQKVTGEPLLASFLHATILNHNKLEQALTKDDER